MKSGAAVGSAVWVAPSVLGTASASASVSGVPGGENLIVNGGFETGDFSGWTVYNEGNGDWQTYSAGQGGAFSGPLDPPPEGDYASGSSQSGPGSHILYQEVAIPADCTATLRFQVAYRNSAPNFDTPPTLDFNVRPNQQYRGDIQPAGADPLDVSGVLQNVFITNPGDPLSATWTAYVADLSALAGMTVRIRFGQVDNQSNFNAAVDDVQLLVS